MNNYIKRCIDKIQGIKSKTKKEDKISDVEKDSKGLMNIHYCVFKDDFKTINERYLDTLDLAKYIKNNADNNIREIMQNVKEYYKEKDFVPNVFKANIFRYLNEDDVAYYLGKRYRKNLFWRDIWTVVYSTSYFLKGNYVAFKHHHEEIGRVAENVDITKENNIYVYMDSASFPLERFSSDEVTIATIDQVEKWKVKTGRAYAFPKYKNYTAEVLYDKTNKYFYGTITGINDYVSFDANSADKIENRFHEAVNCYLSHVKKLYENQVKELYERHE